MQNFHFRENHLPDPSRNDEGKKVLVNSIGGLSWPDNKRGKAVSNISGVVVYGPYKLKYNALYRAGKDKNGKYILKKGSFMSNYYWDVKLDGYDLILSFTQKELTF